MTSGYGFLFDVIKLGTRSLGSPDKVILIYTYLHMNIFTGRILAKDAKILHTDKDDFDLIVCGRVHRGSVCGFCVQGSDRN